MHSLLPWEGGTAGGGGGWPEADPGESTRAWKKDRQYTLYSSVVLILLVVGEGDTPKNYEMYILYGSYDFVDAWTHR